MLKAAIVGCGKIADDHAAQMTRIKGCEIAGVCDTEPLMARQLFERFPVSRYYSDLSELLSDARPDVVHVTTPPASHFAIARQCLEAGCHVFVEKPFALTEGEARRLIDTAVTRNRKITAGHNGQFRHASRRLRALVRSGYLGGAPVHMESYYCYELGEGDYAAALLGDNNHWVRHLPGKLLQNTISHGIAPIAEYLNSDSPEVVACGFTSAKLRYAGEHDLIDELRVIITGDDGVTAYFTFSASMRPALHEFRIYGPKNGAIADPDQESLIKLRGARFKSYAERFLPQAQFAREHLGNLRANAKLFLASDLHMKSDLKCLIELFYRSITDGAPVPIPYREIVLTAKIMDDIFAQLDAQQAIRGRENRELANAQSSAALSVRA